MHFDLQRSQQRVQAFHQEAAQDRQAREARTPQLPPPRPQFLALLRRLRPA
ncbi:hypothetical protein [Deinococcus sp. AJ005]|uniref:hypothetical protein n=1 Tax=Deinococcus sp. AJ005 TaxID=2652443 RepID=UPI001865776C|nr:hypothetical protein [Deinococcus sp. AJ005]